MTGASRCPSAPFTLANPGIGNWEIFCLGTEDVEHAVLYRENSTEDEIVDDLRGLRRHLGQWEKNWHESYNEEQSREMIESRANELLNVAASPKCHSPEPTGRCSSP